MLKKCWFCQMHYALLGVVAGSFVGQGEAFTKQEEVMPPNPDLPWQHEKVKFTKPQTTAGGLSEEQKQRLFKTCEHMLHGMNSMEAKFVQTTFAPDRPAVRTSGKMFVQKPGKLRVNYLPDPITGERIEVLSNGETICQYRLNASREVVDSSSTSVSGTPVGFILQEGATQTHAIIEDVYQKPKGKYMYTMIRLRNRQDPEAGVVTLVLSQTLEHHRKALPTIRFWGWIIRDPQGTRVEVHLTHISNYVKILPATFKIPGKD